jgi:hypothetical protein
MIHITGARRTRSHPKEWLSNGRWAESQRNPAFPIGYAWLEKLQRETAGSPVSSGDAIAAEEDRHHGCNDRPSRLPQPRY